MADICMQQWYGITVIPYHCCMHISAILAGFKRFKASTDWLNHSRNGITWQRRHIEETDLESNTICQPEIQNWGYGYCLLGFASSAKYKYV